jgi:hypothetical protein
LLAVVSAAHGYDTPELFREDALAHIRQLDSEAAAWLEAIKRIPDEDSES